MSYYHPQIIKSSDDLLANFREASSRQFLTGPYRFEKTKTFNEVKHILGSILLYNIPHDVSVYIKDIPVPCLIFDYFNPLIISPNTLRKIEFYKSGSSIPLEQFDCYCIMSKMLRSIVTKIFEPGNSLISYPKSYTIDYLNMVVSRDTLNRQICDLIDLYLPIPSQPPLNMEVPNPLALFMEMFRRMSPGTNNQMEINGLIPVPIDTHIESQPEILENSVFHTDSNDPEDGQEF